MATGFPKRHPCHVMPGISGGLLMIFNENWLHCALKFILLLIYTNGFPTFFSPTVQLFTDDLNRKLLTMPIMDELIAPLIYIPIILTNNVVFKWGPKMDQGT